MGYGYDPIPPVGPVKIIGEEQGAVDPTLGEVFDAWWETENTLGSFLAVVDDDFARDSMVDEDFDPLDEIWGTDYDTPEFSAQAVKARNQTELQRMIHHHVREMDNRDTISRASIGQNLGMAFVAGILDPFMLPFAAIPVVRGTILGRTVMGAGIGIGEAVTEEVLLTQTQQTRTINESMWNVGATGVLAGVLGGMFGKATAKEIDSATSKLASEIDKPIGLDSAGAARLADDGSQLRLSRSMKALRKVAPSLYVATAQGSHARRLITQLAGDNFIRNKNLAGEATEFSFELMTDLERKTAAVDIYHAYDGGYKAYRKAMKGAGTKPMKYDDFVMKLNHAVENGTGDEIMEGLAAPVRGIYKHWGDRAAGVGMIPDVADDLIEQSSKDIAKAEAHLKKLKRELKSSLDDDVLRDARKTKRALVRKLKLGQRNRLDDKAIEHAALESAITEWVTGKEAKGARHAYARKLKENNKIKKEIAALEKEIASLGKVLKKGGRKRSLIQADVAKAEADLDALKKAAPTKTGEARIPKGARHYLPSIYNRFFMARNKEKFADLGIEEYIKKNGPISDDAIDEIRSEMLNIADKIIYGEFDYTKGSTIKFQKHRSLDIDREVLRKHGFLEEDPFLMFEAWSRKMVPQILMKEKNFDFKEKMKEVSAQYKLMIDEANAAGKVRRARFLEKELRGVEARLQGVYDQIVGDFDLPTPATQGPRAVARLLMDFNIYTKLGSVTVSAIPDMGHIIGRVGLRRYAKSLASLANFSAQHKMARAQVQKMGAIAETTLASVSHHRMMLDDSVPLAYKANIKSSQFTSKFITWTGQNHWNQMQRTAHGLAYTDEIMEIASSGSWKTMSKGKRAKFAAGGIGDREWEEIARQAARPGQKVDTSFGELWIPDYDNWDEGIASKMRLILAKEVETGVISPGAGDLPLLSRLWGGKLFVQLKTFQFTSTNKILIPGIQRMSMGGADAAIATEGLLSSVALGAVVYGAKAALSGREISDDPGLILKESIDRSGYFGYLSDANTIVDKISGGYSLTTPLSSEEMSRYYTRSVVGDILGPSLGTLDDMRRTVGLISNIVTGKDVREADIKAARRLVPYQNQILLRNMLFNPIEEKLSEELVQ